MHFLEVLTELNNHLPVVRGHVVNIKFRLVPDPLQECVLFGGVRRDRTLLTIVLVDDFGLDLLDFFEGLALHVRYNNLESKVDDLGCHGEVNSLVLKSVLVDLETLCCDDLLG